MDGCPISRSPAYADVVRKTAIERLTSRLSQISPADRIVLGRKYSVVHWISSGYEELASRVGSGVLEEAERMVLGTALRIEHIRESLFTRSQGAYCIRCRGYHCGSGGAAIRLSCGEGESG